MLERADIDRIMDGVPRLGRAPLGADLRVAATSRRDEPAARRG